MDEECQLIPCSSCNRHVCSAAIACPFCGVGLNARIVVPEFRFRTRLGRSTRFTIGAALVSAGFAVEGGVACSAYGVPGAPISCPEDQRFAGGCRRTPRDAGPDGSGGSGGSGGTVNVNVGGIGGTATDAGGAGEAGAAGEGDGGESGNSGQ